MSIMESLDTLGTAVGDHSKNLEDTIKTLRDMNITTVAEIRRELDAHTAYVDAFATKLISDLTAHNNSVIKELEAQRNKFNGDILKVANDGDSAGTD